ncbi:MAG: hypothetical protein IKL88_01715, partial [Erysipelotrichales bacterium]|nr:hypothetical protein [Erysipelotrichales bacterium]
LTYNLDSNSHTFDFNNYKFNYLTNGNLRTVTADFHIEFTEFLKSVVYQVFEITILTQDNITIKVSYDIDKQEFYDASEGVLENDVMNFNAGMKKNLLMRCERVINKLRNSFATIDTFNTQYQNHLDYEYHEILKATEANIPNLSTNSKVRFKTSLPFGSNYKTFKINFEYIPQNSLVDTQYILYHINEPFNTPSDLFTQDAFIQPLLKVTDHYGCTNGECYINDKGAIYLFYGGDGEYLGLFPLLNYKQAVKDVFGIDSTYTLETGTNEYGFYEDADMGVIITASYDGDGPTIPYGLYVTDSKEENGILTLTYKKYDLEEYIGDQYCPSIDACDHPASYYEEHYRDIVLTHPTWTATLKYNPEKDLYQILSVSKE